MKEYQTVRGMRDFLPDETRKREYVLGTIQELFKKYGFQPMETPAVEYFELLARKGGAGEEIKKEIYYFKDQGGRELGLRFDLTVPTARVVASNPNLPKPFKRMMIGRVWRYDRPGAGRYREFWQADIDVFGSKSALADAECIAAVCEIMDKLGFKDFKVRVNNRKLLEGLAVLRGVKEAQMRDVFRSLDKLDKIGRDGVEKELMEKGFDESLVEKLLDITEVSGSLDNVLKKTSSLGKNDLIDEGVRELGELLDFLKLLGLEKKTTVDLSLARGLDYYTGNVFEGVVEGGKWSVAGGGRYDTLVERYGGRPTPATGISIGVERVIQLMDERGLFPKLTRDFVYVAPANDEVRVKALEITQMIRNAGIPAETDLMKRKLGKQLSYADSIGASKVVVVGPKDLEEGKLTIRDMKSGKEVKIAMEMLLDVLKSTIGKSRSGKKLKTMSGVEKI